MLDQCGQIAGLVDQRKPVIGHPRADVSTAVIDEAAMIAGEIGQLIFPIRHAMNFTVNENQIGTPTDLLTGKVASIDVNQGHQTPPESATALRINATKVAAISGSSGDHSSKVISGTS